MPNRSGDADLSAEVHFRDEQKPQHALDDRVPFTGDHRNGSSSRPHYLATIKRRFNKKDVHFDVAFALVERLP